MKKERKALIISLTINILVALIKLCGGSANHSYALAACGIYTLIDFSTDLIAVVRSSVKRKRVNKRYLFGIGRFEYIIHFIFGILVLLTGIFIITKSFFLNYMPLDNKIILLPLICISIKGLLTIFLKIKSSEISSKILMANAKESFLDIFVTIIILIMVILARNDLLYDKMGCIIMGILIILYSLEIITNCIFLLEGTDKTDKRTKNKIKKIVNNNKDVAYSDCFLIEYKKNMQCIIEMGIDSDVSFLKLLYLEEKIKHSIKKEIKGIKFIDYEIIKK